MCTMHSLCFFRSLAGAGTEGPLYPLCLPTPLPSCPRLAQISGTCVKRSMTSSHVVVAWGEFTTTKPSDIGVRDMSIERSAAALSFVTAKAHNRPGRRVPTMRSARQCCLCHLMAGLSLSCYNCAVHDTSWRALDAWKRA
jgi:hypothetical protein